VNARLFVPTHVLPTRRRSCLAGSNAGFFGTPRGLGLGHGNDVRRFFAALRAAHPQHEFLEGHTWR
jgi:hypothetical protein